MSLRKEELSRMAAAAFVSMAMVGGTPPPSDPIGRQSYFPPPMERQAVVPKREDLATPQDMRIGKGRSKKTGG